MKRVGALAFLCSLRMKSRRGQGSVGRQTRDWEKYERLCRRLRQAREQAGLTQLEAASLLRRPQWFVSRSETGARRVDLIELGDFARVYSKPLSFFVEGIVD